MAFNNDGFMLPHPNARNVVDDRGDVTRQELPPLPKGDDPLAAAFLGIATVINNTLITHPCMVLRRQCQVHQFAKKQHLTPITLIPVVCHMVGGDGIYTLWKGSLGTGVLWALSRVTEIVLADAFSLPRHLVANGNTEKYWKHIYLKAASFAVTTPFIVSTFIETVRSSIGFGYEDSRVIDIIYNGFERLKQDLFGNVDTSRRIGLPYLLIPTVGYQTLHFVIRNSIYNNIYSMARHYVFRKPSHERTRFHLIMPELFAGFSSLAITDLICYPFETVLHRMYIQGTRTLVDNLDTGSSAMSVTFKYTGFVDCFRSIVSKEGFWALYSGIGAVALQCTLHFCVLRGMHMLCDHYNRFMNGGPPPPPPRNYNNTSPVTGLSANAPSSQFAAASGPSLMFDDLNRGPAPSLPPAYMSPPAESWNASSPIRNMPSSLPMNEFPLLSSKFDSVSF